MNTKWQEQYVLGTVMRANPGRCMSILKSRSTLADLQSNVLETEEMYYSSAFQSLFLFVKPYFLEICNILDDFYQV